MARLSKSDLTELTAWRRKMHRWPEVSGEERETAKQVLNELVKLSPDQLETGLGGHGVLAMFVGQQAKTTLMLRCELDALPIEEVSALPHRSQVVGKGHLCGHDGHMAILLGVARVVSRVRFPHLNVVLLFQPAEETGAGAKAVLLDGRIQEIAPEFALSLHNVPGQSLGEIALMAGPVNCASRGMRVTFKGKTAHASQPETGVSPGLAIAQMIERFAGLLRGTPADADFRMATVTHAQLGEQTYGVAPGYGEVWATLRTLTNEAMSRLVTKAERLAKDTAITHGLTVEWEYSDVFDGCINDVAFTGLARDALIDNGLLVSSGTLPMRWSEDFGEFAHIAKTVMLFPGSGQYTAALHNPDYDFPDELIQIGCTAFLSVLERLNAQEGKL